MCIVLHQFAKVNDNQPFTQVQNCPKFGKNEMSVQRVEVTLPLFLCVNTGTHSIFDNEYYTDNIVYKEVLLN